MDIFNKIINNVHAIKKRHNCVGGGGVLTTRPPGMAVHSWYEPRQFEIPTDTNAYEYAHAYEYAPEGTSMFLLVI